MRGSFFRFAIAASVLNLGLWTTSQAGYFAVNNRAALGGNDTLDWGVLGPAGTNASNPFSINSTGGRSVQIGQAGASNFLRLDQGTGWNGNFAPGAELIWTIGANGPMTIDFANSDSVTAAGAQIQANFHGPFSATLQALDSSGNVLASFNFDGNSNANGDDSAIFAGIQATGGDSFDKLRISVPTTVFNPQDFAINDLSFTANAHNAVPLPGGVVLFGLGLATLGTGQLVRRRMTIA
jgi:hypothetical protein